MPLLKDLVILMAASVFVSMIFHRLGLPTIIGFLITGTIIGPYGAGLVTKVDDVDHLAEIGVVMLLFIIGLEFSITRMIRLKREGIVGGGLQVLLTALIGFGIAAAMGLPMNQSVLIGFVVALSSTAIVLKILGDRGEIDSSQGNLSIGILLFQDLCVVLMIIILQTMGQNGETTLLSVIIPLLVAVAAIAVIVTASFFAVPRLLHHVVKLRNREVFLLTVLFLCFGTAWLTSAFGLSLALGAFVAGLVISESEYSHQIVAELLSFRDIFLSLFFISIGMLLDLNYFMQHLPMLVAVAVGIILCKTVITVGVSQMLKYPLRLSIMAGLGLAQIGEFSFVLLRMGEDYKLLTPEVYQTLLAASILTMAVTPQLIRSSAAIAGKVAQILKIKAHAVEPHARTTMQDHVIIIGYGVNGQNLTSVLKKVGIEFVVLDLNWERIKLARDEGHKAFFGDSTRIELLHKMGVEKARMLVVAISDPLTTRLTLKLAREQNPKLYILVRTRYISEVEDLYKLGANQVIPEEFETSVEIFSRVLREYHIPNNIIQNQIDIIRHEGYAMLRGTSLSREKMMEITSILAASVTDTFYVADNSPLIGKTLADLDLKRKSGTMVIAVVKLTKARPNPPSDYRIEAADTLVLLGSHAEMDRAGQILKGGGELPPVIP
ncbi:MAG: cation:proton antiporter [Nitrospirota bacterium]|nr:cation:proton antiporter [Nitrospirota bacterium]